MREQRGYLGNRFLTSYVLFEEAVWLWIQCGGWKPRFISHEVTLSERGLKKRAEIRITEFFPDHEFDMKFTQNENL